MHVNFNISLLLEVLDGKPISENSREFLKRLEVRRLSMPKHANTSINLADVIDGK